MDSRSRVQRAIFARVGTLSPRHGGSRFLLRWWALTVFSPRRTHKLFLHLALLSWVELSERTAVPWAVSAVERRCCLSSGLHQYSRSCAPFFYQLFFASFRGAHAHNPPRNCSPKTDSSIKISFPVRRRAYIKLPRILATSLTLSRTLGGTSQHTAPFTDRQKKQIPAK